MKRLSILICTIIGREAQFESLKAKLEAQIKDRTDVEILSHKDNKELSIGAKRQGLLKLATGDYVCFIDDDDTVSDDYVASIIEATKHSPDCIGFKIDCDIDGVKRSAIASLRYSDWCEGKDGYYYNRSPYHKTPVKREIALKVGFSDKRYAEDHEYSMGLKQHLKKEHFIPKVLYYYRYSSKVPHKQKYGIK